MRRTRPRWSRLSSVCAAVCVLGLSVSLVGCQTDEAGAESVEADPARVAWAGDGKADIYGADDRIEVRDAPSWLQRAARSTALVHLRTDIWKGDGAGGYTLYKKPLYRSSLVGGALCPDERFREQPAEGFCSSFLVGPDLIATAGHCVQDKQCEDLRFAFDYQYSDGGADPSHIRREDAYSCKEVVAYRYYGDRYRKGVTSTTEADVWQDWALIRLDRPVTGRTPLKFREAAVKNGQTVYMVGNPVGLPTKVARGKVTHQLLPSFYITDMDGYSGNSGSVVLDTDGAIAGVFTRGTGGKSFVRTSDGCMASRVCDAVSWPKCGGNHVTKIDEFRTVLNVDSARSVASSSKSYDIPGDGTPLTMTFNVSEDAPVSFVTIGAHMTIGSKDDLRFTLEKVGGPGPVTIIRDVRNWHLFWGETSWDFAGTPAAGTWKLKVFDTDTSNSSSLQKMVYLDVQFGFGHASPGSGGGVVVEQPEPNLGWIGGACTEDASCTFVGGGCDTDSPGGMCVKSCTRLCPDRDGNNATTFCIERGAAGGGECVSQCDPELYPGSGCREGYTCTVRGRLGEPDVTRSVCLPTP